MRKCNRLTDSMIPIDGEFDWFSCSSTTGCRLGRTAHCAEERIFVWEANHECTTSTITGPTVARPSSARTSQLPDPQPRDN